MARYVAEIYRDTGYVGIAREDHDGCSFWNNRSKTWRSNDPYAVGALSGSEDGFRPICEAVALDIIEKA